MVAKKWIKHINFLHQKKYRVLHQQFIVEGEKLVLELLQSDFELEMLLVTQEKADLFSKHPHMIATAKDLKSCTALKNHNGVMAIFKQRPPKAFEPIGWIMVLDQLQDPGNLGTIIRLCDWFGIDQIICAHGSVDCYNPKVLQASMGSIVRVNVFYEDLNSILSQPYLPVFGAYMDGASIYETQLPNSGFLLLGNEGNGISKGLEGFVNHRISIPSYKHDTAESLNVAMAAALLLGEIRRPNK